MYRSDFADFYVRRWSPWCPDRCLPWSRSGGCCTAGSWTLQPSSLVSERIDHLNLPYIQLHETLTPHLLNCMVRGFVPCKYAIMHVPNSHASKMPFTISLFLHLNMRPLTWQRPPSRWPSSWRASRPSTSWVSRKKPCRCVLVSGTSLSAREQHTASPHPNR